MRSEGTSYASVEVLLVMDFAVGVDDLSFSQSAEEPTLLTVHVSLMKWVVAPSIRGYPVPRSPPPKLQRYTRFEMRKEKIPV